MSVTRRATRFSASVGGKPGSGSRDTGPAHTLAGGAVPGWTILTSSSSHCSQVGDQLPARPRPFLSRELRKDRICAPRPEPGSDARPRVRGHHRGPLGRGWNFRTPEGGG